MRCPCSKWFPSLSHGPWLFFKIQLLVSCWGLNLPQFRRPRSAEWCDDVISESAGKALTLSAKIACLKHNRTNALKEMSEVKDYWSRTWDVGWRIICYFSFTCEDSEMFKYGMKCQDLEDLLPFLPSASPECDSVHNRTETAATLKCRIQKCDIKVVDRK